MDKNPCFQYAESYKKNLLKYFDTVIDTNSLSHGYIKSVIRAKTEFIFQLEHDWIFNNNISHSLEMIVDAMKKYKLYHLRFNKRENIVSTWDKKMIEKGDELFKYCITNNLSNNPHIINKRKYVDLVKRKIIKKSTGSLGIEHELLKHPDLEDAIYGPAGNPATVTHTDGRVK